MQITTEQRSSTMRRRVAGLAAIATFAAMTIGATVAPAVAADTPGIPSFSFGDCPNIPAGADPAAWKCEVMTATGSLTLGSRSIPELAPITITHAEGPLPDGSDGQVWGALRSAPTTVPGGLFGKAAATGHSSPLSLRPEYGGRSDFYSVGNSLGLFTMRFRVQSPALPQSCLIGRGDTPVELHLERAGDSQLVSQDPPIIAFDAYDNTFTAPAATGCGHLSSLVNRHIGLPAETGNTISLAAYYSFKTYDQLPQR